MLYEYCVQVCSVSHLCAPSCRFVQKNILRHSWLNIEVDNGCCMRQERQLHRPGGKSVPKSVPRSGASRCWLRQRPKYSMVAPLGEPFTRVSVELRTHLLSTTFCVCIHWQHADVVSLHQPVGCGCLWRLQHRLDLQTRRQ